jgi:hypothetical protein
MHALISAYSYKKSKKNLNYNVISHYKNEYNEYKKHVVNSLSFEAYFLMAMKARQFELT